MKEKEIKFEIFKNLNEGASKSELYNQFKKETKDENLRNILASRPSYELRKKFKTAHILLSIIWGFFILLELLGIIDLIVDFDIKFLFSLIISIYITINIWKFDGRFLIPGIIWFGLTIFNAFYGIDSAYVPDSDYGTILIFTSVYTIILCIGIYLMYYIKKNVFSYYNWIQPILNKDEEIKFED
jgi:hypothetical protein